MALLFIGGYGDADAFKAQPQDAWLARGGVAQARHGIEADPVLNYGNAAALTLWEMSPEELRRTPSRLTAEPVHRDERARLLERTRRDGYVDDYAGVRVSKTGKRFRIEQAIVWNLADATGVHRGQAATFDRWTPLPG